MSPPPRPLRWSAVLLVTLAAFALRAFHLNAQSLWYDEIGSVKVVATPLSELAADVDAGRVEPTTWLSTGYWAVVKAITWPDVADRDATLRWTSAVLGTATVPALAWALAPLLPPSVALGAAAALAVSPFHVWYSQEVRPYVLLLLVSTLAMGAYARARTREGLTWWAAVTVFVAFAMYTHPVALAVPSIIALDLLARARSDLRRTVVGFGALAAAGIAFVPALLLIRAHGANNPADLRGVTLFDVPYAFYAYAVGFSWGPSTTALHEHAGEAIRGSLVAILTAAVVFGALGAMGLAAFRRLEPHARRLLAVWLVLPLALAFGIAASTSNPFNVRYGIVSFPAFVALMALGAVDGPRPWANRVAIAAATISLLSIANLAFDARYAKEDCRSLAAILRDQAAPDDLVIVNTPYMASAVSYYYPGPAAVRPFPAIDPDPGTDLTAKAGDLAALTDDRAHVWLVSTRSFHGDPEGVLPGMLARDHTPERTITVPGIVATRYAKRPGG